MLCETFVSSLLTRLDGKVSDDDLSVVSREVTILCGDYEIVKRETGLVPYDGLPEAYKAYMVTRKIEGLSDKTLEQYRMRLEDMLNTIRKPVNLITTNDIRIYLYQFQARTGNSNRTMDNVRLVLNAFFGWCANEGYCERNVCAAINPIKYEQKTRKGFSDVQLEHLRDACANDRDKAIVEVLYSTGCRASELVGLKLSDVNFVTREVKLFGKGRKHRISYLNAKADVALRRYLESRKDNSEYLFVSIRKPYHQLTVGGVEKLMKSIGARADVDKVMPHKMRHTLATNALAHGMPVTDLQKLLGHSKLETTMIYAEVSQDEVSQAHKRYVV